MMLAVVPIVLTTVEDLETSACLSTHYYELTADKTGIAIALRVYMAGSADTNNNN